MRNPKLKQMRRNVGEEEENEEDVGLRSEEEEECGLTDDDNDDRQRLGEEGALGADAPQSSTLPLAAPQQQQKMLRGPVALRSLDLSRAQFAGRLATAPGLHRA